MEEMGECPPLPTASVSQRSETTGREPLPLWGSQWSRPEIRLSWSPDDPLLCRHTDLGVCIQSMSTPPPPPPQWEVFWQGTVPDGTSEIAARDNGPLISESSEANRLTP